MSDNGSDSWIIGILLIAGVWWWSAENRETEADRHVVEGSTTLFNPRGDFDEESARADAIADVSASTFAEVGDNATCTDDCSGHDAGFEWAKEHEITDASDCSGSSQSFVEACQSFAQAVEEQVDEFRGEAQDE
jgi:hypothetical protein